MWKARIASVLVLLIVLCSCNKQITANSPEKALQEYVNIGFSVKGIDDKKRLLELSAGEAYDEMAKISDQDFLNRFKNSQFRLINFKTKDLRKETNGDVSVIYEISYEDHSAGMAAALTNRKIAYLTKDPETKNWKIKSTTNVKSLVERKDDLQVVPTAPPPQK